MVEQALLGNSGHESNAGHIGVFPLPGGPADNDFFEDAAGRPQGHSWDIELGGFTATRGVIEAGAIARHQIETPELIVVHAGQLSVRLVEDIERGVRELRYPYHPFHRNLMFGLPVGKQFELDTGPLTDEASADFVYTCFYPKDEAEQEAILRQARDLFVPLYQVKYTMSDSYWLPASQD